MVSSNLVVIIIFNLNYISLYKQISELLESFIRHTDQSPIISVK